MATALKTHNLTKQFDGVKAVNSLSVGLQKGIITGLIGPNGSGKTTLVNTLTGMLHIDGGSVMISDVDLDLKKIKPYDVAAYGMTRTFQQIRLIEQMTALDNVLVVLTERGVFKSIFERHGEFHIKQAEDILKKMGIWAKRDENAENLSYGQRKLLEIARALAMKSEVYFFDEPFAGLFPEMRKIVSETMRELKAAGKTVVLIEHDMELIRELTDHVIVLDSGRLLAEGTPSEVLKDPKVVEAYLGE